LLKSLKFETLKLEKIKRKSLGKIGPRKKEAVRNAK